MTQQVEQRNLTSALEDYLETIYQLLQEQPIARVRDIAKARDVKAGSVSPALKRLADMGLVKYLRREYVTLTPEGEEQARRVYSRHRVLTRFFESILKMPSEEAERDACAMEHCLSDEGMDRLVRLIEFLGACTSCAPDFLDRFHRCPLMNDDAPPCPDECDSMWGSTISDSGGPMSIFDLTPGDHARVSQVNARGAIRQRLLDMGILPQAKVELERVAPAGEPVWIKLDGTQLALRRQEAEAVLVDMPT
ncbi:MAG: hypothetical protein CME06_17775 [Gemmatimonadetes bacterium]|nr:hypothetical protein [Gemmatimonadota bacterium]